MMNKVINNIVKEGQEKRPELETDIIDIIFRKLSKYMSFLLMKLKFTPNFVSILAIICSIIGGIVLAQGNYLLSAFSFFLFLLFDYCDGEMARTMKMNSISGHYLDYVAHFIMFASFMIGLSYGIYQYHSTGTYLILGFCGVAGILLRSIAGLLVSEVIIRENLRVKRLLPQSNKKVTYSVPANTSNATIINDENISFTKKFIRVLLGPTGGDAILFFYIPFSLVLFLLPNPVLNNWGIRIVDLYFIYIFLINTLLPFVSVYLNVRNKKSEQMFNNIFGDSQ